MPTNNLHIANNSKSIPNKFISQYSKFLKDNLYNSTHDFIAIGDNFGLESDEINIIPENFLNVLKLLISFKKYDKIIFHSLPTKYALAFFAFSLFFTTKEKLYLVLWGGEVHHIDNSFIQKIKSKLTSIFMKNMHGFITYLKSDFDLAVKCSNNTGAIFCDLEGFYPSNAISGLKPNRSHYLRVLIGSSALERNNHIEIIDRLKNLPAPTKTIVFYIPLSYGDVEYAHKIKTYAEKKLKKENVEAIFNFMAIDKYTDFLSTVDAAIFGHEGQQGMGNIKNLLGFGAKIYLNINSDSYRYLTELGFNINNYKNLEHISNREIDYSNVLVAKEHFSIKRMAIKQEIFFGC
jgi:dTDP-N-acetylfucosamine:lipid II N-acetylfucosaminyltransferase